MEIMSISDDSVSDPYPSHIFMEDALCTGALSFTLNNGVASWGIMTRYPQNSVSIQKFIYCVSESKSILMTLHL